MAKWEIKTREMVIEAEGPNWLMALGASLEQLGTDEGIMTRMVCDVMDDGVVRIQDPKTNIPVLIRPIVETAAEEAMTAPITATQRASAEEEVAQTEIISQPSAAEFDDDDMAFFDAPEEHASGDEAPDDLAEQLFDRGMDIANASSNEEAAGIALQILNDFIDAESASVLFATLNDTGLRFIAATGPSAKALRDVQVPFGQGIAGFCYDYGGSLIIRDAAKDSRHHKEVDQATGYSTNSIIASALRDMDGDIHGVIELLNPPEEFVAWQLDAVNSVSVALADYLRMRV